VASFTLPLIAVDSEASHESLALLLWSVVQRMTAKKYNYQEERTKSYNKTKNIK